MINKVKNDIFTIHCVPFTNEQKLEVSNRFFTKHNRILQGQYIENVLSSLKHFLNATSRQNIKIIIKYEHGMKFLKFHARKCEIYKMRELF